MDVGKDKFLTVTAILMLLKLTLHLAASTQYELHRDEMLYFNMAEHPAFGYVSVPPMTGWLAIIVQSIFGFSVFGIRLIPALLGTASVWMLSRIVARFGGGWKAMLIAGMAFVWAPGFLLLHSLFTPNATEGFLWLWLTWQFVRLCTEGNLRRWMLIGLVAGLSFLNKYAVAAYLCCLLAAMLFSRYRPLLFSRYFLYGMLVGIVVISPNIVWQFQHNWPVIRHMDELQQTQLSSRQFASFFTELYSLLFLSSGIAAWGLAQMLLKGRASAWRTVGLAALLLLFIFLLARGKGYYFMGIVPVLLAAGGVFMEPWFHRQRSRTFVLFLSILTASSLVAIPYGLPILSHDKLYAYTKWNRGWVPYPFSQWEDGRVHAVSQVYADMTGWKELVQLVGRAYAQLPNEEKKKTTVYCQRNYGYAGAIHFYGRQKHLPAPITFLESYVLWAPDTIPKGPVIYVHSEIDGMNALFRNTSEVGIVRDPWFRERGLKVFLCRDPLPGMQDAYMVQAKAEKEKFARNQANR